MLKRRERPAPEPRGPGGVRAWSHAWRLARLNLAHWKLRHLLLVGLIALAVVAYLGTSAFGTRVTHALTPDVELGLGDLVLARLSTWAYTQVRWLDDPRVTEFPRSDERFRCLCTSEPGGELDLLGGGPGVLAVWVARLLTLQLPWGTGEVLFVNDGSPLYRQVKFEAGRPPAAPGEIAVPAWAASMCGLAPGSEVRYTVLDPKGASPLEGALTVAGVFDPREVFFRWALGWLPEAYPEGYAGDLGAHQPRILRKVEPNAYLVQMRPGARTGTFLDWLEESDFVDQDGLLRLDSRYPVRGVWSDGAVAEALASTLFLATTLQLGSVLVLALAFVGLAALTIYMLSFLERRREMAILKAVGFDAGDITALFALEVSGVAVPGLAIGLVFGSLVLRLGLGAALEPGMALKAILATSLALLLATCLPLAMSREATVMELLAGRRMIAIFRHRVVATDGRTRSGPGFPSGVAGAGGMGWRR